MKSHYDKILLVIGLLALAAGIGFYFLKSGAAQKVDDLLTQPPSGPAYESIQAADVAKQEISWPEPVSQDAEGFQLYGIFTPPKIYWDRYEGKLTFEPPVKPKEPDPLPPFGVELVSIKREMFRIQLEAYFAGTSGKPEDAIWQFYNSKQGEAVRLRIGETSKENGFTLKSGKVERVITETEGSTTVEQVPTVVIVDLTDENKEITLSTKNKLFVEGELNIIMTTTNPPYSAGEFVWEEVGNTYQAGDATFTLQEIDFDKQSVIVEKTSPELETPETKLLSPRRNRTEVISPKPNNDTATSTNNENSSFPNDFDSLFN